jgi:transmembrane sensor
VPLTKPTYDPLRDQAVDWLLRLRSPTCSAAERLEFEYWLIQSPSHSQVFEQVERYWEWMEPFNSMPFNARDKALSYQPKPKRQLMVYATAALLLLCVGLNLYWLQVGFLFPKTYQVAKGTRQTFMLADGSSMELNTDSVARVQVTPWQRNVELLRGEAFFKVAHDDRLPFQVHSGNGTIRDIGTAFEIYKKTGQVLVAVQEGIVEVETQGRHRLNAGQQLAYADNGDILTAEPQDIDSLTAWRRGQLVFRGRRLDDVLAEVGRYHAKHIRLQDKQLAGLRVSGTFPTDRLDSLLNAVASILPVHVDYLGNEDIVLKRTTAKNR